MGFLFKAMGQSSKGKEYNQLQVGIGDLAILESNLEMITAEYKQRLMAADAEYDRLADQLAQESPDETLRQTLYRNRELEQRLQMQEQKNANRGTSIHVCIGIRISIEYGAFKI